ncbi:MAG: EAL domain-containing protein [Lachnospiraceae bacterium]|nr:EAL domain-containing protein [Lachnospiraceae bacterium]
MMYYPQYCEAAVIASVILLVMYFLRQNYYTTKNQIFLAMIVDNLLASIVNICTVYTVSYPKNYSVGLNYFLNGLYYALYNFLAILFMLYIAALVKVRFYRKLIQYIAGVFFIVEMALISTTEYTHWVFYFDEDLRYVKNTGVTVLYILAFASVIIANIAIIKCNKDFNAYQVISLTGFLVTILSSVIIQMIFPEYLITNFILAMIMFFIYSAFENPAYYLYSDTQCYNRFSFLQTIRRKERIKHEYVVIAIKIKEFDYIEYSLGQQNAEKMSYKIAERLYRTFGNKVYNVNLNMFAIVSNHNADEKKIIEKVKNTFEEAFELDTEEKKITYSIDIAVAAVRITDFKITELYMEQVLESITSSEDEKIYTTEELEKIVDEIRRNKQISRVLERAIHEDKFDIYYQPIFEITSKSFRGAEALLRLIDKDMGFISPDEFIPIAEKNGQIIEIGEMVMRKVCQFIRDSEVTKLNVDYIDVNLSPIQCRYDNLGEKYINIINEYDVNTQQLNLEITETAETELFTVRTLKNIMDYMSGKGVDFSIDDYGSGFATIDYLLEFPVQTVKIDKSILWQAMEKEEAMLVLEHTIKLLKAIGKKIVVEGVETTEMRDILIEFGCDYLQGYYYSKPLPQEQYLQFLREHNNQSSESGC